MPESRDTQEIKAANLKISVKAEDSTSGLDEVITKLEKLGNAVSKVKGLAKIAASLDAISKAAKGFDEKTASAINRAADSLSKLSDLKISNANANNILKLSSAINSLEGVNYAAVGNLAEALHPLEGVNVNLKDALTQIKKIPSVVQPLNELDMTGITQKLNTFAVATYPLETMDTISITSTLSQMKKIPETVAMLNDMQVEGLTQKLNNFAVSIFPLETVEVGNLGSVQNQLKRLPEIVAALNQMDVSGLGAKMSTLTAALYPLQTLERTNLGSIITQLQKLPQLMDDLDNVDFVKLATELSVVANSFKPLATEMEKVAAGFSKFPLRIQKFITANEKLAESNKKTANSFSLLSNKSLLSLVSITTLSRGLAYCIKQSMDYTENLNLFTVAMGSYAEQAYNYAQQVSDVVGIDPGEWMRYEAVFMSITESFGVASDRAYTMSKNLTQLGYDLSSLYNLDFDTSMQKVQAAISGELEPIRRLGVDLSEARLKAEALELGISKSFNKMTQAEKSQLRYIALMKQTTNAQGDMARTLNAPSNQLRIFKAQLTQAARAIGNLFIPFLNEALPYLTAFAQLVKEAAISIGNFFGITINDVDWSTLDNAADSTGSVTDNLDDATEAAKELKKNMVGIDELNILQEKDDDSSTDADAFNFDLPTYDFLENAVESKIDDIKKKLKDMWELIRDIGIGLAAWAIAKSLIDDLNFIQGLLGATLVAIGVDFLIKAAKILIQDGLTWEALLYGTIGGLATGAGVGLLLAKAMGLTWWQGMLTGAIIGVGITWSLMALYDQITNGVDFKNTLVQVVGDALVGAGLALWSGFKKGHVSGTEILQGALIGAGIGLIISSVIAIGQNGLTLEDGWGLIIGNAVTAAGLYWKFGAEAATWGGAIAAIAIGAGAAMLIESLIPKYTGTDNILTDVIGELGMALTTAGITWFATKGNTADTLCAFGVAAGVSMMIMNIIPELKGEGTIVNDLGILIGGAVAGTSLGMKLFTFDGFTNGLLGFSVGALLAMSITATVKQFANGFETANAIISVVGYGLAGALLGSAVPGLGTALGCAIGITVGIALEALIFTRVGDSAQVATTHFTELTDIIERSNRSVKESKERMEKLQEAIDKCDQTASDYQTAGVLIERLFKINQKTDLTKRDFGEMESIIKILNKLGFDDLNLEIDTTTGHLKLERDAVEEVIEAYRRQALMAGYMEVIEQAAANVAAEQVALNEATKDYNEALAYYQQIDEQLNDTLGMTALQVQKLRIEHQVAEDAVNEASESVMQHGKALQESEAMMDTYLDYLTDLQLEEWGVGTAAEEGADTAVGAFQAMPGYAGEAISGLAYQIANTAEQAIRATGKMGTDSVEVYRDAIEVMSDDESEVLNDVANTIKDEPDIENYSSNLGYDAEQAYNSKIEVMRDDTDDALNGVTASIQGQTPSIGSSMTNYGFAGTQGYMSKINATNLTGITLDALEDGVDSTITSHSPRSQSIMEKMSEGLKNMFNKNVNEKDYGKQTTTTLDSVNTAIINKKPILLSSISTTVSNMWDKFKEKINANNWKTQTTSTMDGVNTGITSKKSTLVSSISSTVSDMWNKFKEKINANDWKTQTNATMDGVNNGINGKKSTIVSSMTTFANDVASAFKKNFSGSDLQSSASKATSMIADGITQNKQKCNSAMSNLASSTQNSFNLSGTSLNNTTVDALQAIIDCCNSGINSTNVERAMANLGTNAKNAFTNIINYTTFWNIAVDVIDGFDECISRQGSSSISYMKTWANIIKNTMRDALGVHSPSRVFAEIGAYTALGYQQGIEQNKIGSIKAVGQWADDIESEFNPQIGFDPKTMKAARSNLSGSISAGVSTSCTVSSDDFEDSMEQLWDKKMEPLIKQMATDMARQADKEETTVVNVGDRQINNAVKRQQKADGYTFRKQ